MLKASSNQTDGLCSVWEGRVGPGLVGAGPHFHRTIDEIFYVLEGEMVLRIGEASRTVRAGTFAFVPRETVHGFRNASQASATMLVIHQPGGFEKYFDEMATLASQNATREDRAALSARFDTFPAEGDERPRVTPWKSV